MKASPCCEDFFPPDWTDYSCAFQSYNFGCNDMFLWRTVLSMRGYINFHSVLFHTIKHCTACLFLFPGMASRSFDCNLRWSPRRQGSQEVQPLGYGKTVSCPQRWQVRHWEVTQKMAARHTVVWSWDTSLPADSLSVRPAAARPAPPPLGWVLPPPPPWDPFRFYRFPPVSAHQKIQ